MSSIVKKRKKHLGAYQCYRIPLAVQNYVSWPARGLSKNTLQFLSSPLTGAVCPWMLLPCSCAEADTELLNCCCVQEAASAFNSRLLFPF